MLSRRGFFAGGAVALGALAHGGRIYAAQLPPLVVVAGPATPLSDISSRALRALFMSDTHVIGDVKLVPFNRAPHSPDRVAFDRLILGLAPDDVSRFWIDRRIRTQGRPPRVCDDPNVLSMVVNRLPGAIAYVRANRVDAGMKILKVDGKLPLTPGYPLTEKT